MTVRVILAPSVSRDDFHETASAIGWTLDATIQQSYDAPYEEIWIAQEDIGFVHYVENYLLAVSYLEALGDPNGELTRISKQLIDTLTADEIIAWAWVVENPKERVQAVGYLAAMAATDPSEQVIDCLMEIAKDKYQDVRTAVLFACAYLSWPALDPLVTSLRDTDSDPDVRSAANRTMRAILEYRHSS